MDEEKAKGQLRLQLNAVMQPYMTYGLQLFVPETISEIMKLAEMYHQRRSGEDVPIFTQYNRGRML